MALDNFIPSVWSESLLTALDAEYVGVRNCNRDFEGDIKQFGDTVYTNAIGAITVFSYTKNTDMSSPETLTSTQKSISINQVKGFNFQIDDVDRAQAKPKIMQAAMKAAANSLANTADAYVYSLYGQVDQNNIITNATFEDTDVVDTLLTLKEKMLKKNIGSSVETVLEVSPTIAKLILKAKISKASDNFEMLENGYIGSFLGFKIYVSNNIAIASGSHKCYARTKRAIAFAEQLSEVEAYRPQARFADAVKGLHLYGASVVYPNELFLLDLKPAT